MITTKQRANLRSKAVLLDPVMQIGKDGLTENLIKQIEDLFEARELFKIKVLQNCDVDTKKLAQDIQTETGCDIVQVIGNKISLYKKSSRKDFEHIQF